MWQKFLYLCFSILLSSMFSKTYAQTVEVVSLSEFSTYKPPISIIVSLAEPLVLKEDLILNPGWLMQGNLIDVVSPKRLKRDASFSFQPTSYTDDKGEIHNINGDITASYTEPIDKGQLAKSAALGVGSYFVKGLSVGIAAIEGAIKNDEDNRLKSSMVSAYESTPFSYVRKGEDLDIKKNQIFFLKFPNPDKLKDNDKKGQNYTYTIEKE